MADKNETLIQDANNYLSQGGMGATSVKKAAELWRRGRTKDVPLDMLIRVDSLLSCLVHRHETTVARTGELNEIRELAAIIRGYTELGN